MITKNTVEIVHSDDWDWVPPVPEWCYKGWWIQGDEGEMMGPYLTKEAAEYELGEAS